MTSPEHAAHADNAAAYLLGALPEPEAAAFRRHVEGCVECRAALERLRPAVDALPRAVTPMTPPASLRDSLMRAARADLRSEPAVAEREREADESRPAPAAPAGRRRWFSGARLGPVLAGAAVLVALAGVGGAALTRVGEPEPRTISAEFPRREVLPEASARLRVTPGEGPATAVLEVSGLPVSQRRVYELWLQRGDRFEAATLLAVREDGTGEAVVTDSLEGVDAVLVTREPAGGSPAPTEDPVISVPLA